MNPTEEVLIWGAGKIGRGFVPDLLETESKITFVDADKNLVEKLNKQGCYTIHKIPNNQEKYQKKVDNFEALAAGEKRKIVKKGKALSLMVVAVYPEAFPEITALIAEIIEKRVEEKEKGNSARGDFINIILCNNTAGAGARFQKSLQNKLSKPAQEFLQKKIGLIDSLVIRTAVAPPASVLEEDPLAIYTSDYPYLIVDETAVKGELPQIEGLKFSENIKAEKIKKIYTYNMFHAVLAYQGKQRGYTKIIEAINDEEIFAGAVKALEESLQALQLEYDFSDEDRSTWKSEVIETMTNLELQDKIDRVGAAPKKKLGRADRLTGPALLCRKHGILPYYLARAIAAALLYYNPEDEDSAEIQKYLNHHEIKEAITKYTGLNQEKGLINLIYRHYRQLSETAPEKYITENTQEVELIKKAYARGFKYEKIYKGCAQCTLLAMFDILGEQYPELFQAASGLSAGIGLCGDSACGGYTGGTLLMGTQAGRRLQYLEDGDDQAKYKSYNMAEKLHDKFIETYGSVICRDIHEQIFGRAYILKNEEEKEEFEEAGAHEDKCTSVVAKASQWTAELLLEEELLSL